MKRTISNVGQVVVGHVAVELALPLLEAPEVGQVGVEAAEVGIGQRQQLRLRRRGHDDARGERIAQHRDAAQRCRRAVERLVDEEAVVADAAARAEHGVPDVAGAFFAVGAVELDLVAHARQQIGVERVDRVDRVARRRRRERIVHRADRSLAVVRRPAAGVVDRRGLVVDVRAARRRAPLPAVLADLARATEVVQVHEPLRERVEVGRDRLRELRDVRVAVAAP